MKFAEFKKYFFGNHETFFKLPDKEKAQSYMVNRTLVTKIPSLINYINKKGVSGLSSVYAVKSFVDNYKIPTIPYIVPKTSKKTSTWKPTEDEFFTKYLEFNAISKREFYEMVEFRESEIKSDYLDFLKMFEK